MAEEKAFELGKRLGQPKRELTPEEKKEAEARLAWSRAQSEPTAPVEKG